MRYTRRRFLSMLRLRCDACGMGIEYDEAVPRHAKQYGSRLRSVRHLQLLATLHHPTRTRSCFSSVARPWTCVTPRATRRSG